MTNSTKPTADGSTKHIYNEEYFQGGKQKSNYDNYVESSRGPTQMLAETLFRFFRPASTLDVGCAVGHTVKRLRELGVESYGLDISDWAVEQANVPYVQTLDIAKDNLSRRYELVYSYDVLEHLPIEKLESAAKKLWNATSCDMLIVPATYENGETFDPNEPTHLIFESHRWWRDFFIEKVGAKFDEEASERFAAEEHSRVFNYDTRILIFTRLERPNTRLSFTAAREQGVG